MSYRIEVTKIIYGFCESKNNNFVEYEIVYDDGLILSNGKATIDVFRSYCDERPDVKVLFNKIELSYGELSDKSESELKALHDFMRGVMISFIEFRKNLKENKNNKIFNVGFQFWNFIGKISEPYDPIFLLTEEYQSECDKKKNFDPKYDTGISSPSAEWGEMIEPIYFIVYILGELFGLNLKVSTTTATKSRYDLTPKVFSNGKYSWVTEISID